MLDNRCQQFLHKRYEQSIGLMFIRSPPVHRQGFKVHVFKSPQNILFKGPPVMDRKGTTIQPSPFLSWWAANISNFHSM